MRRNRKELKTTSVGDDIGKDSRGLVPDGGELFDRADRIVPNRALGVVGLAISVSTLVFTDSECLCLGFASVFISVPPRLSGKNKPKR